MATIKNLVSTTTTAKVRKEYPAPDPMRRDSAEDLVGQIARYAAEIEAAKWANVPLRGQAARRLAGMKVVGETTSHADMAQAALAKANAILARISRRPASWRLHPGDVVTLLALNEILEGMTDAPARPKRRRRRNKAAKAAPPKGE